MPQAHLGVVRSQGLLIDGLHDADLAAGFILEEICAAEARLRGLRLLAGAQALRDGPYEAPNARPRVHRPHNLCSSSSFEHTHLR